MANTNGLPRIFWIVIVSVGVFVLFNIWIMKQVANEVSKPAPVVPAAFDQEVPAPKGIPEIDPNNDPLAPVAHNVQTPEAFLQRQPQASSDERKGEFPHRGQFLIQ